ncbi:phage baseplate assembly protein V [Sphingomonas sp. LT1P40]|uniref:phage baseplate assembly protein V n=1 Tax=Alteristakelama amylovorans TaxID=3096166 RepID=UPI002FCA81C8
MSDPADLQRLLGDVVRLGTVASVDLADGTCRVHLGDLETGDIPWLTGSAGDTHIWCPPSIGEQVIVLAPEGDTLGGIVLRGLPSDTNPAPGDGRTVVVTFADGAKLSYDPEAQLLDVILPEGGKAKLICDVEIDGKLTVTGDARFDAKIHAKGEIASDADVKAEAISLKSHKHGGVQAGVAKTAAPE